MKLMRCGITYLRAVAASLKNTAAAQDNGNQQK